MPTPDAKSSILGSSDLTEDVILEILLRLPVKSLVQFKCVCKQWYAIVESKSFIEQHFGHMSNEERLLVRHYKHNEDHHAYALFVDGTCSGFEEPAHLQRPNMISQVLGPVNGVFCLVGESNNLALLNPATRQLKPLPRLPEVILNLLGFGLDLLSRDYKVVSATCIWDARAYACHPTVFVYNLGSDSWRNLGDAGCSGSSILVSSSLCNIYLNGVYYWAIGDICFNGILAFDMTTEKYQEIQVPDCLKLKCGHLTIHGDSIAVLSYELPGSVCEVWVMEKEGSWNRVAVIGPYQDMAWPLCLWKNNELLIEIDTLFLMLCNIFTNKRQLTQARAKKHAGFLPFVFSYKESLVFNKR